MLSEASEARRVNDAADGDDDADAAAAAED